MPKMKTHKGAAKRFKITGSGKIRRRHAYKSHLLKKKTAKRKRRLRTEAAVSKIDTKKVRQLLGV
jgi:large subunit ribosomal protein L35